MVRIKLCRRLIPTTCAVFYETAGTIGPIAAVKLIDSVGENFSFFLAPVSLALSGIVWSFISLTEGQDEPTLPEDPAVENLAVENLALQNLAVENPALQNPALQNPAVENLAGAVENPIPHTPGREPGFLKRLYKSTLSHPKEALIPIQTLTTYRLLGSFDL